MNPHDSFRSDFDKYLKENKLNRCEVVNPLTKDQKKLNRGLKVKVKKLIK